MQHGNTKTVAWVAKILGALAIAGALTMPVKADTSDLVSTTAFRVCADPANMPFSNKAGEGYENKIAELLASKLGLPVQYTWFPQATGFVRRTLKENRCDVIISYAQGHELVLNTNHYYVSSYVFVTPEDSPLAEVDHIGDPSLKGHRLGVVAGSPPASHLVRNGLIGKAKPYQLVVDRRIESPAEQMIADIENGEIDGAFMWGPIAGYFAQQSSVPLKVTPLLKEEGAPRLFYRITMGVRQGELQWKRKLNSLLRRNKDEIHAILESYGVPLVDTYGEAAEQ
ncbi:substrate-binding domain-containing protein [Rhodobacteraceae bacterium NNCM2]|nr:substrate-binding domain-containing protein [Coraliihabitans acroporae]